MRKVLEKKQLEINIYISTYLNYKIAFRAFIEKQDH
jgi:hypothetical protein